MGVCRTFGPGELGIDIRLIIPASHVALDTRRRASNSGASGYSSARISRVRKGGAEWILRFFLRVRSHAARVTHNGRRNRKPDA